MDVLKSTLDDIFKAHPQRVGMTYIEHMMMSCRLSGIFMIGSIEALIHAVIPFVFEKGSTKCVSKATQLLHMNHRP
jgi:hypothetical protein